MKFVHRSALPFFLLASSVQAQGALPSGPCEYSKIARLIDVCQISRDCTQAQKKNIENATREDERQSRRWCARSDKKKAEKPTGNTPGKTAAASN